MPLSVHAEPTAAWREFRAELRRTVGESTYEIWLEPLDLVGLHDGRLVVSAPAATHTWLSKRFGRVLAICAERVLGDKVQIELLSRPIGLAGQPASRYDGAAAYRGVGGAGLGGTGLGGARVGGAGTASADMDGAGVGGARGAQAVRAARETLQLDGGALNPRYSFNQFIIGDGNRLAHAAALAVAELPGQAYNPLFLHAPPGLGKTHLLHAIGNYVRAFGGGAQVRYTTVEAFTNHFIHALGSRSVDRFKHAYRDADVLLIDDVQFLASKAKTEEEFFHTFNAVYETGRQLVLTCDRLPRQLVSVEERLRERFESGLVAVIKPPDFGTRVAILRKRAALDRVRIDDQTVLDLIADRITDNVRALEGALIRVVAYHSLTQLPIDVSLTTAVLDEICPRQGPEPVSLTTIQQAVATYYGVTESDLKSPSRAARVSWPRQVAIHLARELTDAALTAIGEAFGGRNHATVLHACKRVEERAGNDQQLVHELAEIRQILRPRT